MAAKTSWHRHGTQLGHCRCMRDCPAVRQLVGRVVGRRRLLPHRSRQRRVRHRVTWRHRRHSRRHPWRQHRPLTHVTRCRPAGRPRGTRRKDQTRYNSCYLSSIAITYLKNHGRGSVLLWQLATGHYVYILLVLWMTSCFHMVGIRSWISYVGTICCLTVMVENGNFLSLQHFGRKKLKKMVDVRWSSTPSD